MCPYFEIANEVVTFLFFCVNHCTSADAYSERPQIVTSKAQRGISMTGERKSKRECKTHFRRSSKVMSSHIRSKMVLISESVAMPT